MDLYEFHQCECNVFNKLQCRGDQEYSIYFNKTSNKQGYAYEKDKAYEIQCDDGQYGNIGEDFRVRFSICR